MLRRRLRRPASATSAWTMLAWVKARSAALN
jgi:hypothetical protein